MHSIVSPFGYTFGHVPEEHFLPLSALQKELGGEQGSNGVFDFSDFNGRMRQPTDRWIPAHWASANCGMAEAIANLACYCRRFITRDRKDEARTDAAERFAEERFGILKPNAREALKKLAPLARKWELPKAHCQVNPGPSIAEKLARLDFSRCRKHEPETIRRVLELSLEGAKPSEIRSKMGNALQLSQIKGILRTYKQELKKMLPTKEAGGDSPSSPQTGA
jgi:hypothetical protein